jgi:hypothetical protein
MWKFASIAVDVFQARRSHIEAHKCYESKTNKDELIKVTIGLAELMREGDMIWCLFELKEWEDLQCCLRVRDGCKVIPMQFWIQRYILLEETNGNK